MSYILILGLVVPAAILVYCYYQRKFCYWSDRGIAGPPPTIIFGNFFQLMRLGPKTADTSWHAQYGPVMGIYHATQPILMVADPELIKQILVKDFYAFVNRNMGQFSDREEVKQNLVTSEDEQWKRIRAITSPSFSSGKLRGMSPLIGRCADQLVEYLETLVDTSSDGGLVDAKEIITGFSIDVIASTAFGTATNCNLERETSVFRQKGLALARPNPWRALALFTLGKRINRWIGNSIVDDKVFEFFVSLTKEIIKQRKSIQGPKRMDLVQLMLDAFVYEEDLVGEDFETLTASDEAVTKTTRTSEAKFSAKKTLTETEIIANLLLFFTAGFETTATTLSNCLKHLTECPDVQERLAHQLASALESLDESSEQYYETVINELPYLEAVIKETLRMDPPTFRIQRRVGVSGYKLNGIPLEKDLEVNISTNVVHYNAQFYPNPETFTPERFLPENRHHLTGTYTYLPFGQGPRNCVGMRFAYNEMKLCLAKLVRHFRFESAPPSVGPSRFNFLQSLVPAGVKVKVSKR